MTLRIGTHSIQVVEAPSGCLVVMIGGKLLTGSSFIFESDALSAAQSYIEEDSK
jgi:hypothetical protein